MRSHKHFFKISATAIHMEINSLSTVLDIPYTNIPNPTIPNMLDRYPRDTMALRYFIAINQEGIIIL